MDASTVAGYSNLVHWTFSGKYDCEKPILIDATNTTRSVSKKKAEELVTALAGAFKPDSTVCLHIPNDVLYPVLVLAILASDCRWTGTNTAYTAPELEHHFRLSETEYIITAPEHLEVVRTAVTASGTNAEIILFADLLDKAHDLELSATPQDEEHERTDSCKCSSDGVANAPKRDSVTSRLSTRDSNMRTLRDLVRDPSQVDLQTLTKDISLDSTAAFMQTSGTTGLPKMAARTHRSMIIEQENIEDNNAAKPYEVRRLYCTPIFHGFSAPEMLFNVLRLGQTSYFMRRFDSTFAQKVHDLHITETFGAPPMMLRLVNQPGAGELLQSLRMISFGGAPLASELRRKTLELFETKPRIVPVYGMTEGGWFTTLKYPDDDHTGSVGRPIPGCEVKVIPQQNTELNDGQPIGEIFVRGAQLMSGYLNNPEATAEAFEDGWLKTGDIGYVKDGMVYLVDRAKDLIKCNGWQVSPAELENALLEHPDVLDAAVLGVGQGVDEHPLACVVVRDCNLTADLIKLHLRGRLTGYKVSKCEVRFVQAIPKNPAGKILRKVLRETVRY
ncbi:hypothetical protein LTR36_004410 [Oleoguttula mirabilis]|uniref:Uncharacterized protein n=1 Tax=Oleoguttula mirabilis TaxID=1507867 RepID=A0AAV9JH87_9PEZI|nr:hypothetical protein LTR36_004410 [Oleoguttula mirabilis]